MNRKVSPLNGNHRKQKTTELQRERARLYSHVPLQVGRPSHPEPLIESLWVFFLTHETESARKLSEGGESKKEKKNAERDAARPLPASHSSHATRRTIVNRSVHATWPAEVGSFTARSSHTRSPVQRRRTGMGLYPHLRMLPIGKKKQRKTAACQRTSARK